MAETHLDRERTIRFFWDFSVRVPLWMSGGLVNDDPEWLRSHLGLSDELIEDITAWGSEMCHADEHEGVTMPPDMNERAERLVERLRAEIGDRYDIVHLPE